MTHLSPITPELAQRLLMEVEFGEHLEGAVMAAMTGSKTIHIYRFTELVRFLKFDKAEGNPLQAGTKVALYWVDVKKIIPFIRDVYGDRELGDAIEGLPSIEGSYYDQIKPVWELLNERLSQVEETMNSIEKI